MTDPATLRRPITIAHRYGNTLDLLRQAEEAGADFVEMDVWLRHGRLEVRHEHTMGPVPIWYDKWKLELPRPVPLLGDILAALPARMGVMIDLKGTHPGMPAAVIAAVEPYINTHPIMVSARTWSWLPVLMKAHPELMLFHSVGKPKHLIAVQPMLELVENDAISIHYDMLSAEAVASLKEMVSLIATWPINDETRLRNVLAWGADAIISDDLNILRTVARERG
jgi:glycerophosphoryl diester phosphodiesterase